MLEFNFLFVHVLFSCLAICSALAFTNFESFDGKQFEVYPEACGYYLLKDCSNSVSLSSRFAVKVQNEECEQTELVQNCKKQNLYVSVNSNKVQIKRTISGEKVNVQVIIYGQQLTGSSYRDGTINVEFVGYSVVLTTEYFELVSSGQNFYLTTTEEFKDKTCGLCGKYNGDTSDDLLDSQGGPSLNVDGFLRSWSIEGSACSSGSAKLGEAEPTQTVDYCAIHNQNKQNAESRASRILDENGPFKNCLAKKQVGPEPFYRKALKTGCRYRDALCDVAAGFAKACEDKGIAVDVNWRVTLGCTESKYNLMRPSFVFYIVKT